jgi:outer membrane protein assembly factor BamE
MRRLALLLIAFALSACSWLPGVGIYKLEINQGNYVTSDMAEKLRLGQTKNQVRAVLGTPLVADAFHGDRWEYVYILEQRGRVVEQRRFSVFFEDDKLARWGGDELPPSAAQVARIEFERSGTPAAPMSERSWWERIKGVFGGN